MVKYVFIALFAVASVIHLAQSWKDDQRRAWSKPFLLLFLLLFYLFAAKEISWVLVAALFFSWLGDVLLIPKGSKWFLAGGIAFLVSHILFILVYAPHVAWTKTHLWLLLPACVYLGAAAAIILKIRPNVPKALQFPMLLYLAVNSTMNLFALAMLLTLKSPGAAVAYAGAVLFYISDCTLYLVRYHENKNLIFKKHFTVMLTYLLGECLITVGMLMI